MSGIGDGSFYVMVDWVVDWGRFFFREKIHGKRTVPGT